MNQILNKKIYSKNIIINTLQIGLTKTKLLKKLPNKNYNKRIKLIPINRMAKPKKRPEKNDYGLIYIGLRKNTVTPKKTKNKMKKPRA